MAKKSVQPEHAIELRNERINLNDDSYRRRVQQGWRDVQSLREKTVGAHCRAELQPA